jgi:hypothetical protein
MVDVEDDAVPAREANGGLILITDSFLTVYRDRIAALAALDACQTHANHGSLGESRHDRLVTKGIH